jgi:hypothetical protein
MPLFFFASAVRSAGATFRIAWASAFAISAMADRAMGFIFFLSEVGFVSRPGSRTDGDEYSCKRKHSQRRGFHLIASVTISALFLHPEHSCGGIPGFYELSSVRIHFNM